MDSKGAPLPDLPGIRTRGNLRRLSLHIEPSSATENPPDSPALSSASVSTNTHLPPISATLDLPAPASAADPTPSASKAPDSKEKRKRSRVTPEQLTHLERIFTQDRSPTAQRRKEISEMLGMQERQTQIWFQNRRAKAKLQEEKRNSRSGPFDLELDSPPNSPPDFDPNYEADIYALIHEEDAVSIIPCTDLCIGSWRRIATGPGKHDLVAYMSLTKRCLTWFIHSSGYGFKMEIPFTVVQSTEFQSLGQGRAMASFFLSGTPSFYLEGTPSPRPGEPPSHAPRQKVWKTCTDWTEGTQATSVARHDLIGSATQLLHVLRVLRESSPMIPSAGLVHPHYPSVNPLPELQLPQPPMMSLAAAGAFTYSENASSTLLERSRSYHGRQRSFTGPPALTHNQVDQFSAMPNIHQQIPHPASATYPSSGFPTHAISSRHSSTSISFNGTDYQDSMYSTMQPNASSQPGHAQRMSLGDYSSIPISHAAAAQRPISSTSLGHTTPQPAGSMHEAMRRFSSSSGTPGHFSSQSPPPLLTTPFTPATNSPMMNYTTSGGEEPRSLDQLTMDDYRIAGEHPDAQQLSNSM